METRRQESLTVGNHEQHEMSTAGVQPEPGPRRPWFQYNLRTLLFLTLASAILFSFIGYERQITAYREAFLEQQFGRHWPEASWSGKHLVALEFNAISKPRKLEHLMD